MSAPFEAGERALLVDRRGRHYLVTLRAGDAFHSHQGSVPHDNLIGAPEGVRLTTTNGAPLIAFRPSYADFVLKMPRGAQVIYPKDVGLILVEADIYPGSTILEAGTGSGALSIALARAAGPGGRLISYELREDFHARARSNIEAFFGKVPDHVDLRQGDVAGAVESGEVAAGSVDRVVLDLPEPWRVAEPAAAALRAGGIWCSYVPTVPQVSQTTEAVRAVGFAEVVTREVLVRTWHVEGMSVRPDHRMVAHTGFVTIGRLLGL